MSQWHSLHNSGLQEKPIHDGLGVRNRLARLRGRVLQVEGRHLLLRMHIHTVEAREPREPVDETQTILAHILNGRGSRARERSAPLPDKSAPGRARRTHLDWVAPEIERAQERVSPDVARFGNVFYRVTSDVERVQEWEPFQSG